MLAVLTGMYLGIVTLGIYLSVETYRTPFNPIPIFLAPFCFFTAGTPLAYLLGYWIFPDILVAYLPDMVMVCMIAALSFMAGVPAGSVLRSDRRAWAEGTARRLGAGTTAIHLALSLIPLAMMYLNWELMISFDKVAVTQDSGLKYFHYGYTTLMLVGAPLAVYLGRRHIVNKWPMAWSLGIYTTYCLLTQERDFLLLVLAMALVWRDRLRLSLARLAMLAGGLAMLLTLLFAARIWLAGAGSTMESPIGLMLGQGLNPLIDTNILQALADGTLQHTYGSSYLTALVTRIGLWRSEPSLADWFVPTFFPLRVGLSFYGFSLEAEAFLAGGYYGVVIVFFILGLTYSRAYSSFQQNRPLGSYLYLVLATLGLYAVRNESRMLVGGISYALIFYAAANVAGWLMDLARQPATLPAALRRAQILPPDRMPPVIASQSAPWSGKP